MQFGYKVLRALCILYFVNICPNRGAASYLLFCYYIINSYTCQMMHRLRRYDVFRFAQNDVAPLRSAMMRCLPQCAVRHASFAKRTSSGVAVIICRRQTSFKKRTFVYQDKCSFLLVGKLGIAMRSSFVWVGALCSKHNLCAALRKIPRSLCSSRLLYDGGMRHSVRCCRPGFAT